MKGEGAGETERQRMKGEGGRDSELKKGGGETTNERRRERQRMKEGRRRCRSGRRTIVILWWEGTDTKYDTSLIVRVKSSVNRDSMLADEAIRTPSVCDKKET